MEFDGMSSSVCFSMLRLLQYAETSGGLGTREAGQSSLSMLQRSVARFAGRPSIGLQALERTPSLRSDSKTAPRLESKTALRSDSKTASVVQRAETKLREALLPLLHPLPLLQHITSR